MRRNLLYKLFFRETKNFFIQLFRYGIVGGISFLIDFGILFTFTEYLGFPYIISSCIGFIGGLTANYLMSIQWVFNSSIENKNSTAEFLGFALVGIVGLGLNALIMWFFTELIAFHYLSSKIISTIIVFGWNFIGRRFLTSKVTNIYLKSWNKRETLE